MADVAVGDLLVAVDGRRAAAMTRVLLLGALGGAPGQQHWLILARDGHRFELELPVSTELP